MQHHEAAVLGAVDRYSALDGVEAIVLGGSVAHGTERADSDIDLTLFVDERTYDDYVAAERVSFSDDAPEFYDHAYFDVKVATIGQLELAVGEGDDPVRASHLDARVLWSSSVAVDTRLRALLAAVVDPPLAHWAELEVAFLAQAWLHGRYFLDQAEQLDLGLLRHHAAVHFAFGIGRALLARNRVLFSGPKYLERDLGSLAVAPPGIATRLRTFLDAPSAAEAEAILAETEALLDTRLTGNGALSRFVEDNELAWLTGKVPPEYR